MPNPKFVDSHASACRHGARQPTRQHSYSENATDHYDDAYATNRHNRRAGHRAGPRWRGAKLGENESDDTCADRRDEDSYPELNQSHSSLGGTVRLVASSSPSAAVTPSA